MCIYREKTLKPLALASCTKQLLTPAQASIHLFLYNILSPRPGRCPTHKAQLQNQTPKGQTVALI